MNAQTILDHIIFQLTPTRTRCEIFVVAGDVTERMTSGLLKPFLSHLHTAEEQLATGGYSIKLEPPDHRKASWFTKGTAERFVRFVSSPDVVERVNTIETELVQLEETIRMQILTSTRVEDSLLADSPSISLLGEETLSSSEKPKLLRKTTQDSIDSNDSGVGKNSKKQLLRALEARRLVLQKEQGMAFARAAAAGYELVHLLQLIMFSDCFGAARLREACFSFVALSRKRQIAGFCAGDTKIIYQDLTWALSNTTCSSILKSMEEISTMERIKEEDIDGLTRVKPSLHDEEGYQQKLPAVHVNLGPADQVHAWSSPTDVFQGWPEVYASRNNPYATFQGYQYGFSPCSHESFSTLPSMSPSDATELYGYPMGVLSQQPSKTQNNLQMSSSPERQPLPSLRKLHVGHRGMQRRSRMAGRDINSKESYVQSEKPSNDVMDSSTERSDSLKAAPVVLQGMGMERNRRSDSSDLSDSIMETDVPSFRAMSSGASSSTVRQNMETSHLDRSFKLHQHYDAIHEKATSTVRVSKRTSDDSLFLFDQCREGSLGSKPKKRLDFQEPEAHCKQQQLQEASKSLDDSFYVYSPPINCEQRTKPTIESELQSNQIYSRMSKQALKVNSGLSHQHDPDDLLMMPRQRKRAPARKSGDVMNIDVELLGSVRHVNLPSSQKASVGSEPSQERVKKFLDQYNEKREAKLRGEVSSSKRAEREGKLKSLKKDLEKRKSEMAKPRKPERTTLQAEAQVRADKLRLYKAGLQKVKKEKEEEERRRLEALKAQRQERIAARSNPSSSTARGRMSSPLPTSKLSPVSRLLPPPQNSRSLQNSQVFRSSLQRNVHSRELDSNRTPSRSSKSFPNPGGHQLRSSTPSVPRQTGRASIGSQPSTKTETLKVTPRTKTPAARTNNLFSTVFGGRENQIGRTSSLRKSEPSITSRTSSMRKSDPSSISNNKQGFMSGSRAGLPLERRVKGLISKAGNDNPRSAKQEGRTFLRKGGGTVASGRSVEKTKSNSPAKVKAADKRPLFSPGTHMNAIKNLRLEASQVKASGGGAGVAMSRPTGVKINRSTLKEASQMKVSEGGAGLATSSPTVVKGNGSTSPVTNNGCVRVNSTGKARIDEVIWLRHEMKKPQARGSVASANLDSKSSILRYSDDQEMATSYSTLQPMSSSVLDENHMPSIPRYSRDKEMATPSYSTLQPMPSSVLEKNHMPSEGGMSSLNLHKGPPVDSAIARLMLFDRSCTKNFANKQIIFDTISPTESAYRESTISSGNAAKQDSTPYSSIVHTSNGIGKRLRVGQRSSHSPATLEGDGGVHDTECDSSDATSNHGRLSLNGFIHPSQSSKNQSQAAVLRQGSDPKLTAKALRPFAFLGTFRSKAS